MIMSPIYKTRSNLFLYFFLNLHVFYLFGVLRHFQHCTGLITMGSWKGRGNQYIQFVRVLYCKLQTNSKQLPAFPLEAVPGTEPRPQRWEASVTTLPPWPLKSISITFASQKYILQTLIFFKLRDYQLCPQNNRKVKTQCN